MPISDIYVARVANAAVNASAQPLLTLYGTAAKRLWVVGCRVEIVNASTTGAGNSVLFQLAYATAGSVSTASPIAGIGQDPSNPSFTSGSAGSFGSTWVASSSPTIGNVIADWTVPETTGSAWEEFPPLGYEFGVPAIANGQLKAGLSLFCTPTSTSPSISVAVELVWSE